MTTKPIWTPAEITILIRQYNHGRGHPVAIAAKLPGRTPEGVRGQIRRLIRLGHLNRRTKQRSGWRRWQPGDDAYLLSAVQEGMPTCDIARKLGRSETSVRQRVEDLGHSFADLRGGEIGARSTQYVADLFGVCRSTVFDWVKAKELGAHRRRRRNSTYLISDEQIMTFLAYRPAWPDWDPANIVDPDWRQAALEARQAAGAAWLDTTTVAQRYHTSRMSVAEWCREGRMPAMRRKDRWHIWSADLTGWRMPNETVDVAAVRRKQWETRRQKQGAVA